MRFPAVVSLRGAAGADGGDSGKASSSQTCYFCSRTCRAIGSPLTVARRTCGSGERFAKVKPFKLKPPQPSESQLHAAVAKFLDLALLPPAVYSTFPAGWGKLPKATAGRLYQSGMKPGMPDIFIWYRMTAKLTYRCIGIEIKTDTGYPSPAQRSMFAKLLKAGVIVYVCRDVKQVLSVLREEEVPIRRLAVDSEAA